MSGIKSRSLDAPDEIRTPDKSTVAVVTLGDAAVARKTLRPGWRWSECIKPIAGTDHCQVHHLGVVMSGRLHVEHRDKSGADLGPGDVYAIDPGHDAWVLGDEPFVGVEFDNLAASTFATQRPSSNG